MTDNTEEYLVQLQLESIQTYLFSYLSVSKNLKTLAEAKHKSDLIAKLTDIEKNESMFSKKLFPGGVKFLLENNKEKILLNISGKCILKLSNSEKKELESNIQKNYIEFLKESIEISYFSEKIENDNIENAYEKLNEKVKSQFKQKEIYELIGNFNFYQTSNNEKESQTTRELLSKYCHSKNLKAISESKANLEENTESKVNAEDNKESSNYNQIAIIKADMNGMGKFFKELESAKLSKKSDELEKIIKKIEELEPNNNDNNNNNDDEKKYFPLYINGDDIFIISAVSHVKQVLEKINNMMEEVRKEISDEITIGIGVLTTDYRSTFRYYFNRVENLMGTAKENKKKDSVNINGEVLTLKEGISFLEEIENYVDEKNENKLLLSKTKLHNVIEVLESTENRFKLYDAIYILTKEKTDKTSEYYYDKLSKNIEDIILNGNEKDILEITNHIRNLILFSKYYESSGSKKSASTNIEEYKFIVNDGKFEELMFLKEEEKEEISLNKETIEIVIKVQNLCGIGKGFWFKLEDILTKEYNEDDAKKNTIEKYLSNYQIGNKNLIYGSVDEDQWKKLSDDKKSKFNEERKNRRKSINKKIENVIEKIVEDIIEKEDEYRKLLRVNIIKINKKERR